MTFDWDFSYTHSERGVLDTRACYIAANIKHKQNSCHLTRYNDLKVNKKYRRWKMRIRVAFFTRSVMSEPSRKLLEDSGYLEKFFFGFFLVL